MSFLGLTKKESRAISLILVAIVATTVLNLQVALRKARDNQRKNDIRSIYDALNKYQDEFGSFPAATEDGKIIACHGQVNEQNVVVYQPCEWYQDSLPHLSPIPGDPRQGQGRTYIYKSNSRHFQVFAALESNKEPEFSSAVESRNIACNQYICNFGRSDGKTPLDKSLQEYENELRALEDEKKQIQ